MGFRSIALAAGEQRCLNLQSLLRERKVRSAVDFALHDLPAPGKTVICVGASPPALSIRTPDWPYLPKGRAAPVKKPKSRKASNRQKLDSYADLSPAIWWSMSTMASAGMWAW